MLANSIQTQKNVLATSHKTTSAGIIRHNTNIDHDQQVIPKQGIKLTSTTTATSQNHSKTITEFRNNKTIENFQKAFCAIGTEPHFNAYVSEYVLPQSCEMPLGIAVDNNAKKVWYVSTKKGLLGSYDLRRDKFDQEYVIPAWKSRENPLTYSQVWDIKIDKKEDIWFTDEGDNAIWKYVERTHAFEIYHIPGNSSSFGTTYPVSIEFNPYNDKAIYFVGTFSTSLWIGDLTRMKNGTSDGISQIPIPINDKFKGIDTIHISTGSIAFDSKRNAIWISMLAYGIKGEIIRYNLKTHDFSIFDLPAELNSPVGLVLDNSYNLWITNAGTSIFYKLEPDSGNIIEFVTSKASPRVYGLNSNNNLDHFTTLANISKDAYTLPYWIKKAPDGSLWFNEQEGNKIAKFDPNNMKLTEYWIPTQNRIWGNCEHMYNSNTNVHRITQQEAQYTCGIANVLQFSTSNNKQIWFTEWSENKIGKIDTNKKIPFSVETTPQKEMVIKRGETGEIKIKVKPAATATTKYGKRYSPSNKNIHIIISGTFTPTGDLGNSTTYFDKQASSSLVLPKEERTREISFGFTPSTVLKRGEYTLMIGVEDDSVSYLKAMKIKIT